MLSLATAGHRRQHVVPRRGRFRSSVRDRPVPSPSRGPLALLEVVVIAIIAVLIALFLPAVQSAREAARRAKIAWIAARNDRAWYALGHARNRLAALGQDDEAIFALDRTDAGAFPPDRRAVISLARKLTVDPALVADEDINALRKHFTDKQVAEIVFQTTEAAYFDRLTEAAGLRLEK
jgi:alkylhydroperoxidase family enzyme